MELYGRVRRAVQVEGTSEREAARQFGIARETVRKMQRYSAPPGYQRKKPVRRPKLGPWVGVIDQILKDDESRLKKQRHTAKRIWDRLRAEHGFTGGYTIVKDYVREARQQQQEMFVPLAHPPGDAQADFGEALAVIDGKQLKAHFLCIDLPHSDDGLVMAFPAEQTEAFCEGHNHACAYFGGVPQISSTTTRRSRWPRFSEMGSGNGPRHSPSCSRTTCSTGGLGVRRRAMTRGR